MEGSAFYGDGLDETLGTVLDATKGLGLLAQAETARCFNELVSACLEVGQNLPPHTFIVSTMDTQRN